MDYSVVTIPPFDKRFKRLVKKYPSLKVEYALLIDDLQANPTIGVSLGNNCYKIKMAISSKGKSKSGGARVISYVREVENTVFLLSIFDKSEHENISDSELNDLLSLIP